MSIIRLDESLLNQAVQTLTARDPNLERIIDQHGPPPLWNRTPGFGTLLYIILEQQVSLASARAAYERLLKATQLLTPASFILLSDTQLKTIGFSRQKTAYGRNLAAALIEGRLDLSRLDELDDVVAKEQLMKIKGIGSWTADIYLLMALGRPDIWPNGDLALATAVQKVKGMTNRPSSEELFKIGLQWQPWRAVAARILWHFYLNRGA